MEPNLQTSSPQTQSVEIVSPIANQTKRKSSLIPILFGLLLLLITGAAVLTIINFKKPITTQLVNNDLISPLPTNAPTSSISQINNSIYPKFIGKLIFSTIDPKNTDRKGLDLWSYEQGKLNKISTTSSGLPGFSVNGDGKYLAYIDTGSNTLRIADLLNNTTKDLGKPGREFTLSYSGNKIAVIDESQSNNYIVSIIDIDSASTIKVPLPKNEYITVKWSLDDSKILIQGNIHEDAYYLANSDGSHITKNNALSAEFSHDNQLVLYNKDGSVSVAKINQENKINIMNKFKTTGLRKLDGLSGNIYSFDESSGQCQFKSISESQTAMTLIKTYNMNKCGITNIYPSKYRNFDSIVATVDTHATPGQYKIIFINKETGEYIDILKIDSLIEPEFYWVGE